MIHQLQQRVAEATLLNCVHAFRRAGNTHLREHFEELASDCRWANVEQCEALDVSSAPGVNAASVASLHRVAMAAALLNATIKAPIQLERAVEAEIDYLAATAVPQVPLTRDEFALLVMCSALSSRLRRQARGERREALRAVRSGACIETGGAAG